MILDQILVASVLTTAQLIGDESAEEQTPQLETLIAPLIGPAVDQLFQINEGTGAFC